MGYNYSALNGRITEMYGSQKNFATALQLSERSLSLKLNGRVGWKQKEIEKAKALLGITVDELGRYFFTQNVQ